MFLTLFVLIFIHDMSFYSMTVIWPVSKFTVPSLWLNLILNISREKSQFSLCIFGVLHFFWSFLPPVCFTKILIFMIYWFQDIHSVVYLYSLWAKIHFLYQCSKISFRNFTNMIFLIWSNHTFSSHCVPFMFCCCYNCHPCLVNLKIIVGFSNITLHDSFLLKCL